MLFYLVSIYRYVFPICSFSLVIFDFSNPLVFLKGVLFEPSPLKERTSLGRLLCFIPLAAPFRRGSVGQKAQGRGCEDGLMQPRISAGNRSHFALFSPTCVSLRLLPNEGILPGQLWVPYHPYQLSEPLPPHIRGPPETDTFPLSGLCQRCWVLCVCWGKA